MVVYNGLRKILREKRMLITEMGRKAKISQNIVAKIGRDEYISLQSLEKIAKALKCDIGDLVNVDRKNNSIYRRKQAQQEQKAKERIPIDELEGILSGNSDGDD